MCYKRAITVEKYISAQCAKKWANPLILDRETSSLLKSVLVCDIDISQTINSYIVIRFVILN